MCLHTIHALYHLIPMTLLKIKGVMEKREGGEGKGKGGTGKRVVRERGKCSGWRWVEEGRE